MKSITNSNKKLGLYIHIPFCEKKCSYCDFNSYENNSQLYEAYINAIIWQLNQYKLSLDDYVVDTIYIGGGTPSILPHKLLKKLIKAIKESCTISKMVEFTMEVNPASGLKKTLKKIKKYGVNRLSIGLQSADDTELSSLGRIHNLSDFETCYNTARQLGFNNISIDLMFSLPNQSLESFRKSLNYVISKNPEHISVYSLKVEENTPFYQIKDTLNLPDEDTDREMYELCVNKLSNDGYEQYEISNFAKAGYQSAHNLKYWNCQEYLGLGSGAHSYFTNKRFSFIPLPSQFIENIKNDEDITEDVYQVAPDQRVYEYIMLGFRLNRGIDTTHFSNFYKRDFEDMFKPQLEKYLKSGHIKKSGLNYHLTLDGMSISNYIISDFVDFKAE